MSSPGQIVGTIAGAVIGSFIPGGYIMLGAAIGGAIGGAIDPPKGPDGPRLQDLAVQGVGYGSPIPRLYGIIPTFGTIFWVENGALKETEQDAGGKGGASSTTYGYSATFALALCQGPIQAVKRIWISGKLIYDGAADTIEAVIASNEAALGFRVYTGTSTQLPDPRMQATLGVEDVPAYRGLAYLVFDDLDLSYYGNTLMGAQIKVEVICQGASWVYENIVYTENTGSGVTYSSERRPYIGQVSDGFIDAGVRGLAEGYRYRVDGSFFEPNSLLAPYIPQNPAQAWFACATIGDFVVVVTTAFDVGSAETYNPTNDELYHPNGAIHLVWPSYAGGPRTDLSVNLPSGTGVRIGGVMVDARVEGEEVIGVWFLTGVTEWTCYLIDLIGEIISTHTLDVSAYGSGFTVGLGQGASQQYTAIHYEHSSMQFAYAQGSLSGALAIGQLDGSSSRILGYTINNTWGDFCYPSVYVREGLAYAVAWDGASDVVAVLAEVMAAADTTTLRQIVEAECVSSNLLTLSDIDATALTPIVRGYKVTATGTIRSAIEPLQAAWPFDAVASGYKVKFVLRGGASVDTVAADELGAAPPGESSVIRLTNSREMDIQLPRRVEVTYLDVSREYDPGEQFVERLNTDAINVLRVELPIVLSSNEGAGKAEVLLYLSWMERNDLVFVLPPTFTHLEPADVITVSAPGATHTARLTNINYLPDGRLECTAKPASFSIYTPVAIGESSPVIGQSLVMNGGSVVSFMDVPTIHDAYGTPGYMVGMRGIWPSWAAGALFESSDGGQSWVSLQAFTQVTAIGDTSNSIGAGVSNAWDRKNVLNARLFSGALNSATADAVLNRGNHFAYGASGRWEIIGVQTVTETGTNTYSLRNLLRGRAGTEWAMALHQAGDSLIHIDERAIRFINSVSSAIGVAKLYKAVSNGQALDEAASVNFTYSGVNLKPLSPVLPKGSRHPSTNDWTLRCTRRTRIDGELRDYVDVPIGETSEAYRWVIYSSNSFATVKRTVDTSTPALTYTSAQQTTDFSAIQEHVYFDVAQISETVGAGYPLRATISMPAIFETSSAAALMLYFDGADGGTTFTDSATPQNTVTSGGGGATTSTTYALSGGSSFWANGNRLTVDHAAWMDGGSDPWTIEFFIYEPTLYNAGMPVGRRNNSAYCPWLIERTGSGLFQILIADASNSTWAVNQTFSDLTLSAATWTHAALVFTGTAFKFFLGGVKSSTEPAASIVATSTQPIYVGSGYSAWSGYMEDLRYTPGEALYSANFTPPASPL